MQDFVGDEDFEKLRSEAKVWSDRSRGCSDGEPSEDEAGHQGKPPHFE
jgi:hypothetical protein